MQWACDIFGHTLVLSCPLAACFGARLFARVVVELEETSRSFFYRKSVAGCGALGTRVLGTASGGARRRQRCTESGCFQYVNAAYANQSGDGSGADASDGEDEELDFCILTPQQALGVLGEHAPQYAKIFLNGFTFVADRSEPGMVLSVDEYADRMHVSLVSRHQSSGGSLTAVSLTGSSTTDIKTDATASPCSVVRGESSACSDAPSLSLSGSCEREDWLSAPLISGRSSFDASLLSYPSSSSLDRTSHIALENDSEEGLYCGTTLQTFHVPMGPSVLDVEESHLEHVAAEAAVVEARPEGPAEGGCEVGHSDCATPGTSRDLSMPSRLAASLLSVDGVHCVQQSPPAPLDPQKLRKILPCTGTLRGLQHNANAGSAVKAHPASGCLGRQDRSSEAMQRSASHGGVASNTEQKCPQRRWVPSGARSVPPPIPPLNSRTNMVLPPPNFMSRTAHRDGGSSSAAAGVINCTVEGSTACCQEMVSVLHSPPQPSQSRPCGCRPSGGIPTSPSASPAGLCKAPALPLPDGSTLESAVPPALQYYIAQARAVVTQDAQDGEAGRMMATSRRRSSGNGAIENHAGSIDIPTGRSGFVRATVEQLNTQRLVCCHVTPYAAAKTSRKPRPLAHRVGYPK